MCGEREQISSKPYTEQEKQSPSLHIRKVCIEFFWNFFSAKREISKAGHHHQFPHHRPFPFQIQTIRSPELTSTTIHFFFSQFCKFGYKTLLLIDFFFLFNRFRFDSFLLWVFGFSIKMFVFSILDICFCFVFCLFF